MTLNEFSDQFDVLLNSFSVIDKFGKPVPQGSIELDEYEKSVFLTKAQEQLVIDLYTGRERLNGSLEDTEEISRMLSNLIATYVTDMKVAGAEVISPTSIVYNIPNNFLFIIYESARIDDPSAGCENGSDISVVPISHDEYFRIVKNPFRGPNNKRVLRLSINQSRVELISKYRIKRYFVRGITRPNPIILVDLPKNLTINGEFEKAPCLLHEALHRLILRRAVENAIASKTYNIVNK